MLSSMLVACSLVCAAPWSAVDDDAAAWIRVNAVPVRTPVAESGFEDLEPLRAMIGEARIVGLGEPTHGTREAFQFKHRLLEFLVERMGFTIFSIEANMPESYALNAYVQGGVGDPKKLIAGMYFWTWNTQEVLEMVEWMRRWNAAHPGRTPLQFTGFDMQTSTVAAAQALEFIHAHAPDLEEKARVAFDRAGKLEFSGAPGGGFGSATGSFPIEAAKGKKLVLSAWIRTENVSEFAGAWWRTDTPTGVNGFNNMADKAIKGTTDWTRHEFTLDVAPDCTNISFGFILAGEGTAWFDDLEITLDGVKYENPERFSFDFENDAVRYLGGGGGGYSIARVKSKPRSGTTCLEIRRNDAVVLRAEDVIPEAAGIVAELEKRLPQLSAASSPKDAAWAVQNARVVHQRARMFGAGMAAGSNVRDECMADNVAWILAQNPGQKIVLWAHNAHVSRGQIWGTRWMGSYLEDKFPGEQVIVGFTTGAGEYTAFANMGTPQSKLARDNKLQAPPEDSVEHILSSAGIPAFILDLRKAGPGEATAWSGRTHTIRSIGAGAMEQQFFPCVPKELFDLLVWQDKTTASREIP